MKDIQRTAQRENAEAKEFKQSIATRRAGFKSSGAAAAPAASSSGASSSSSGSAHVALIPLSPDVSLDALHTYLPKDVKVSVGYEPQSGSIRAWYMCVDGSKRSCNASTTLHGDRAPLVVLQKIWELHEKERGVACPYRFP